jgi:H+/Cl- antiporter ClcA
LIVSWREFDTISIRCQYCCRYALLGAASFLGGSMRMTVSLCVIMVEITNNLKLLPLIMLVLLVSKVLTLQSMTTS